MDALRAVNLAWETWYFLKKTSPLGVRSRHWNWRFGHRSDTEHEWERGLRASMREPGCRAGTAPSLTPDHVIPLRKQCPKITSAAPAESDNCCSNVTVSSDKAKTSNPGPEAKPDTSSPEDAHV